MRTMTLEKLMSYTDDKELLDIYRELESGKVPSTSYAHEFCRKVNRMIDSGDLRISDKSYRHIYLPTLSKVVYKEMAKRYAIYMSNCKAPDPDELYVGVMDGAADDPEGVHRCAWCKEEFDESDLVPTDLGMLCERCINAIRSRGEQISELA